MRARAAGFAEVPARAPARRRRASILGADLELGAVGGLRRAAPRGRGRGALWSADLRELAQNRMLRLMGLAPLVDGAALEAEGARVHGRLRIPEDKREALAERVLLLLQAVARQRGPAAPQP